MSELDRSDLAEKSIEESAPLDSQLSASLVHDLKFAGPPLDFDGNTPLDFRPAHPLDASPNFPPESPLAHPPESPPAHPPESPHLHNISPDAVKQSEIADCFFQATLASLAETEKGKQVIQGMISNNDDGSQTVKFPGADQPIVVTKEELENSPSSNRADWARTLETAFLKYNVDGDIRSIFSNDGVGPLGRIRTTREAIKLLTGDSVGVSQFAFSDLGDLRLSLGKISKENVEEQLKWGVEHDSVMTAGASWKWMKLLGENNPWPARDMHVYSVLDYDAKTQEVTLRNPHGRNGPPFEKTGDTINGITSLRDGRLKMSLDTFYSTFGDLNVSGRTDGQNAVENVITDIASGNASSIPSDILNANTSYLVKAGGWALEHPVTTLIIPPAPFVVAGITQMKEVGASAVEQMNKLGSAMGSLF